MRAGGSGRTGGAIRGQVPAATRSSSGGRSCRSNWRQGDDVILREGMKWGCGRGRGETDRTSEEPSPRPLPSSEGERERMVWMREIDLRDATRFSPSLSLGSSRTGSHRAIGDASELNLGMARWRRSGRWGRRRRSRKSPRRNGGSSLRNCTAGRGRVTRCRSSATMTASGSASKEIWKEYGIRGSEAGEASAGDVGHGAAHRRAGARDFSVRSRELVVVTDAEIFGRYKVQRPRRLKSAHAQATRSALDIDFTEFEEGDYVVHLQHGIGRYLGLQVLPVGAGTKNVDPNAPAANDGQECLVIEYARARSGAGRAQALCAGDRGAPGQQVCRRGQGAAAAQRAGRHALGEGEGAGRTGGARRGQRVAGDPGRRANRSRAMRSRPTHPGSGSLRGSFIFEETPDQMQRDCRNQGRHGTAQADGPADLRRRRVSARRRWRFARRSRR